jgi:hypothetical protein
MRTSRCPWSFPVGFNKTANILLPVHDVSPGHHPCGSRSDGPLMWTV